MLDTSGTPSLYGHGISSLIIAQSVGIISWTFASSVKQTKPLQQARNAQSLGAYAMYDSHFPPHSSTDIFIQARLSLPLYLAMAQNSPGVSARQQGLGISKIRQIDDCCTTCS